MTLSEKRHLSIARAQRLAKLRYDGWSVKKGEGGLWRVYRYDMLQTGARLFFLRREAWDFVFRVMRGVRLPRPQPKSMR